MRRSLLSAIALAGVSGATDVMGSVSWNKVLGRIDQLPINTKVSLGGAASEQAFIRHDGTFVIHDVGPGSYVLKVHTPQFTFNRLRVDVLEDPSSSPVVAVYDPRFSRASPAAPESPLARGEVALPYPIQLVALGEPEYDPKPQGFHPIKMLTANPMYLLMGGMILTTFLLPKLIGMMDPEALAEMQKNQATMHKSMGDLQSGDFSSAFSKILNAGSESGSAANGAGPPPPADSRSPARPQGASSGVKSTMASKKRR